MIEKKLYHAEAKDMPLTGEYSEYPIFDICKEENVTVVRSVLKAGAKKEIKVAEGTYTSLIFTDGMGKILATTVDGEAITFAVTEPSVLVEDQMHSFIVCAETDLTWTSFTVEMNEEDYWHLNNCSNYAAPYFTTRSAANAIRYIGEKSKTPGSKSFMVVPSSSFYRITIGFVEFSGDHEGAFENAHPICDQWQVAYGEASEFYAEVAGTKLLVHKNDAQFFDGGQKHSMYTEGDHVGGYIYWEMLKYDLTHSLLSYMQKYDTPAK